MKCDPVARPHARAKRAAGHNMLFYFTMSFFAPSPQNEVDARLLYLATIKFKPVMHHFIAQFFGDFGLKLFDLV